MSIVLLENISKNFGKSKILNNVNIEVNSGEIVGLIGPSGSGKTTIVKTIMGMETPTSGMITVLNTKMPNRNILQKIGYMAQADALYEDLYARDNLIFFAKLFSVPKNEIDERIDYVASLVDLTQNLSKKVKNYSGGMKRRLSLAISLIQNPDLLILDEPTVGIDPQLRLSIWSELNKLKNQGKTIIITTHVMDEAEKCDRLNLIRNGNVIANGTPTYLKEKYQVSTIEEVFLKAGDDK